MTLQRPVRPSDRLRVSRPAAAALGGLIAAMAPVALVGALAVPLRADARIDDVALGVSVGAFFAMASACARPCGRWVDRLGWQRSSRLAAVASATVLLALATVVRSPLTLIGVMALGGSVAALATPASNLALAREVPPGRLGLATGINQASVPIGMTLAGLSVPLVALTWGWRWPPAIAAILALALWWLVPAARLAPPAVDRGRLGQRPARRLRRSVSRRPGRATAPRGLVALALACFLAGLMPGALAGFLVITSVDAGLSQQAGATLLAASGAGGILVRIGSGWAIDRTPHLGLPASAVLLAIGALGLLGIASRAPALLVVGGLLAFSGGWGWTGLVFFSVLRAHPVDTGAAVGFVVAGGSLGAALGPVLFGSAVAWVGHSVAWSILATTTIVGAGLLVRVHTRGLLAIEVP